MVESPPQTLPLQSAQLPHHLSHPVIVCWAHEAFVLPRSGSPLQHTALCTLGGWRKKSKTGHDQTRPRPEDMHDAVTCVCRAGLVGRRPPRLTPAPFHLGVTQPLWSHSWVSNAQEQLSHCHNFMWYRKSQAKNTILGSYFQTSRELPPPFLLTIHFDSFYFSLLECIGQTQSPSLFDKGLQGQHKST